MTRAVAPLAMTVPCINQEGNGMYLTAAPATWPAAASPDTLTRQNSSTSRLGLLTAAHNNR